MESALRLIAPGTASLKAALPVGSARLGSPLKKLERSLHFGLSLFSPAPPSANLLHWLITPARLRAWDSRFKKVIETKSL